MLVSWSNSSCLNLLLLYVIYFHHVNYYYCCCYYCMGFAQHRPCRGNKNFIQETLPKGSAAPGSFATHHEVRLNCFGVMLRIDSRNALPSGQRGRITLPAKHFFSEILRLPGTGIAKMRPEPLCWPILGLCWPIWGLCWGRVRPS